MDYMATQFLATKGFITRKTECFTLNKPHEAQINVSTLGAVRCGYTTVDFRFHAIIFTGTLKRLSDQAGFFGFKQLLISRIKNNIIITQMVQV